MRMGIGLGVGINRSNYAQGIFGAYQSRVVADGGTTEAGGCVDAGATALLQTASLLLIPSGYKASKLYSQIPTNGNGDLTWTRASDAWRTNADGLIQRVPWNLVQYSEAFDNGAWSKVNATITTNTTTAPNGTLTADKLTATATTSTHILLQQPAGSVSGATSTLSIYAKSAGLSNIQFLNNAGGLGVANFNLSAETAVLVSGVSASIENVGNGWYRCIMTYTPTTSGNYNVQIRLADSSGNTTFLGNGTDGVYIWGAQLVEGTTAQTYLPTTDRLGFPRLDYTYGSCPALLLEPQRTNLNLYSEDLGNAYWSKFQSSVTTNVTTSPDGTTNADKLIEDTSTNFHSVFINTAFSVTIGQSYTRSIYAKADGRNWISLLIIDSTQYRAFFNLSTGVVGTVSSGLTASIQSVGNGWYRCSVTRVAATTSLTSMAIELASADNTGSYTGNGTSGVFLYGAQIELGAYPTTYIPTTTASATRVADSFSRNNIYTNGLITSSGGTWFVELRGNLSLKGDVAGDGIFLQTVGNTDNFRLYGESASSSRIIIYKRVSNVNTLLYTTTTDTTKLAIKWNGSTADVFANGTKVVSATTFTATQMQDFVTSINATPKFIQQMALYPTPLTDAQCIELTTL